MIIDPTQLNETTLTAVIDSFLHRGDHHEDGIPGADYARTITHIRQQLARGELYLTFDATTESINILNQDQLREVEALAQAEPDI
jgi:uncharacterized protein YheU (UPF0270 family)